MVKESVAAEWNKLCRPSSVLRDVGNGDDNHDGNRTTTASAATATVTTRERKDHIP